MPLPLPLRLVQHDLGTLRMEWDVLDIAAAFTSTHVRFLEHLKELIGAAEGINCTPSLCDPMALRTPWSLQLCARGPSAADRCSLHLTFRLIPVLLDEVQSWQRCNPLSSVCISRTECHTVEALAVWLIPNASTTRLVHSLFDSRQLLCASMRNACKGMYANTVDATSGAKVEIINK